MISLLHCRCAQQGGPGCEIEHSADPDCHYHEETNCVASQQGEKSKLATRWVREWQGLRSTLVFLEEKVSKNDLNGKLFSLPFFLPHRQI